MDYKPGLPRWLPPVADDGSTKGVGTTLPVVNRRASSGSAPYQAHLAIEKLNPLTNPGAEGAPWSLDIAFEPSRGLKGAPELRYHALRSRACLLRGIPRAEGRRSLQPNPAI